jgi:hypothetical protein
MSCSKSELSNSFLTFQVQPDRIVLTSSSNSERISIAGTSIDLKIDGRELSLSNDPRGITRVGDSILTRMYEDSLFTISEQFELRKDWNFVTQQLFISSKTGSPFKVNNIQMIEGNLEYPVTSRMPVSGGKYGVVLRSGANGCFVLIQNPFGVYEGDSTRLIARYEPEMKWNPADGPFPTDRLTIGFTTLTGTTYRQDMAPEWVYEPDPATFLSQGQRIDLGEIEALTRCTQSFLGIHPAKSARVHVGWCENDYQIDMAKPEGRTEYRRIIDQAAAVGCDYVLFTPDHSKLSSLTDNADAWGWESLLFLNLGQKIRKGEWVPKKDPIPEDVKEIIDYAGSKNIKLLAYAYPSLPFLQNPEWTAWRTAIGQTPGGYLTVDTGLKSFQDWFVDLLIDFYEYTGIGGYSFDHWWTAYTDEAGLVSSKYQQWYGMKRILDELRRRAPEILVDTRQQVHHFGTWSWLAGTYPHPMMSDEQPGSFNAIPDLSTDRVSGARQRYVAWRLMTRDFTPAEVRPGFITHQTQRGDKDNVMRRDHYRTRDWDYFGWQYNLISSIATAPFNHVVNYLPARDPQEFEAFSAEDKAFFRRWMDFTDENLDLLRHVRPIIGQPMVGRCDGTSAILDDHGFLFVFNPNYRGLKAEVSLDRTIGLTKDGTYRLTEMYPLEGRIIGNDNQGDFKYGSKIELEMKGVSARIIRVEPVGNETGPVLYGMPGTVSISGNVIEIKDAIGLTGSLCPILVRLPSGSQPKKLVVNGKETSFSLSEGMLKGVVKFAGEEFASVSQIGSYDPGFNGPKVEETLIIPERIKAQMERRKQKWLVDYTEDDMVAPWAGPSRLLLYLQIAEPYRDTVITWSDGQNVHHDKRKTPIRATDLRIEINGNKADLKEAYNGVYPYVDRTNLGYFVDISDLKTNTPHRIRVILPKGLKPGQYQGLFVDHVEDEYTQEVE